MAGNKFNRFALTRAPGQNNPGIKLFHQRIDETDITVLMPAFIGGFTAAARMQSNNRPFSRQLCQKL